MTFRLDVRWRRKAVKLLALPAGSTVIDLASGTGDLCIDLAASRRTDRCRSTSASACWPPIAAARPRVQADILRLPLPDALGRRRARAVSHCATSSSCPRSSPNSAGWCAPADASPCSTSACRTTRSIRWGNNIYFGKVVPKIGALLSDGAAYRYLPKSVAYLPSPARSWCRCCAPPGSPTPSTTNSPAASPSCCSAPGADRDARRQPTARSPTSISTTSPAATAICSCATASASPAAVSPHAFRIDDVAASSAAIDHDRRGRRRASAGARAWCRSNRARRASWSSRRWPWSRPPTVADG